MDSNKGKNAWRAMEVQADYVMGIDSLEDLCHRGKMSDYAEGLGYLNDGNYPARVVTVFGGARAKEDSKDYNKAYEFGKKCAQNGWSVMTGGGPGIMEAANKGCYEECDKGEIKVKSIGIGIELPFEAKNNEYLSRGFDITMKFFFTRKTLLLDYSDVFVAFKGGVGTLDEIFECVTLMQTGKIKKRPIYMVNKDYWRPIVDMMNNMESEGCIKSSDFDLIKFVDDINEIEL